MSAVQIKKIEMKPSGKLTLEFEHSADGRVGDHVGKFDDPPAPEFDSAMARLATHVCDVLEVSRSMAARIHPQSVQYSYLEDGRMSAIIACSFSMPVGGTETDIKTPKTKCPMDEHESGKPGYFSDDAVNALWELQQEALKYLSGHRAQSNLFDMDAEAEDVPEGVQIAGGNVLRIAQ